MLKSVHYGLRGKLTNSRAAQHIQQVDWSARFNRAVEIANGLKVSPILHRNIYQRIAWTRIWSLPFQITDSTITTATITGRTGYIAPGTDMALRCSEKRPVKDLTDVKVLEEHFWFS
ncbi:hypothetical protein ISN44_As08g030320 [Arabidopsis suecica]|uniref:Uncharacterized protein n=1 Tax=Arabidopsis suecica TaxID=45249 RepID=A0A8T2BED7_ARASU|nr:hypothetical protein ISN44_As08g030320 [Arabidopsis suecica]